MDRAAHFSEVARCPLFTGVEQSQLDALRDSDRVTLASYPPGCEIPLSAGGERALVVLTQGTALAYSRDAERAVLLRAIGPATAFGVSVLFSEDEAVSVIRAKTASVAVSIPASLVARLLDESAVFRRSYVSFLSGRIRFLNRRIACYTAGSAERRLALYLLSLREREPNAVTLDLPLTDLSELLDVGRASLYRAFTRLSEYGLIERHGRRVAILDRSGLLRYESDDTPVSPSDLHAK